MRQDTDKNSQGLGADAPIAQKTWLTSDQICGWIDHLKPLGKGFTSVVNNAALLEAMKCYLIVACLDEEELIEYAEVEIFNRIHYQKGAMDTEEAVRIAIKAVVKNIRENLYE